MQTPPSPSAPAPALVEVEVSGALAPARKAPPPPAMALQTYAERCAVCHGDKGAGDGPAAKGLMTKPRRFSDALWQEGVDDAHIQKAILEGGFAIKKSSAMPAHPDLREQVAGLVLVVRSFRSPTGTVAVDVLAADGKVTETQTVDPNTRGTCRVRVPLKPDGPRTLSVRVAGKSAPVCTIDVGAPSTGLLACDASAPPPPAESAELTPGASTAR